MDSLHLTLQLAHRQNNKYIQLFITLPKLPNYQRNIQHNMDISYIYNIPNKLQTYNKLKKNNNTLNSISTIKKSKHSKISTQSYTNLLHNLYHPSYYLPQKFF